MTEKTITFPREWCTSDVIDTTIFMNEPAVLIGVLLHDGSNMFGLAFPGGARFLRISPDTDWALEERYTGRPPRPRQLPLVQKAWKIALDSVIASAEPARADVERILGQGLWAPGCEVFGHWYVWRIDPETQIRETHPDGREFPTQADAESYCVELNEGRS